MAAPGADRATVLALSPEAKAAGITRGMPVRRARKQCPDLMLVPPNPVLYARASRALHEILGRYAPVIEPRGYGHAFLDVTGTSGLFGPAVDVAVRIQREARQRLQIPLSVGVAVNKLVSQAAATVVKKEEGGAGGQGGGEWLCQVGGGEEPRFLAPQPVSVMPDLDADMRERLDEYQLELIGEIAAIERRQLCAVFGAEGTLLHERARGIDPRPVLSPERKAEFRFAHTLATDTNDLGVLHPLLRRLTERLGHRLRLRQLTAGRLTVALAYTDYATARRSVPLTRAALDVELWDASRRAFALACQRTIAVRALGVTVDRLGEGETQMDLWKDGEVGEVVEVGQSGLKGFLTVADGRKDRTDRESALQGAVDRDQEAVGGEGSAGGEVSREQGDGSSGS